jgi:hypothetical protein
LDIRFERSFPVRISNPSAENSTDWEIDVHLFASFYCPWLFFLPVNSRVYNGIKKTAEGVQRIESFLGFEYFFMSEADHKENQPDNKQF